MEREEVSGAFDDNRKIAYLSYMVSRKMQLKPGMAANDTHGRTIAKALTWRVGGFAMTVAVAWAVTRRADVAASIGLADTVVKLGAYYAHERLWLRVRFGRVRPAEYEI